MSLFNRTHFLFLLSLVALVGTFSLGQTVSVERKAAVKEVIREYIQQDQNLKGAFLIKDKKSGSVRDLKFDHLHEGVNLNDEGKYVACVDFKQGGSLLDVDFYVTQSGGRLEVSDIIIHKIDGKDVTNE